MDLSYGFVLNTIVPVRAEPDDRAEMVTQLLFGEAFEIREARRQWRLIRSAADGYEGWIDEKSFVPLSADQWEAWHEETPVYLLDTLAFRPNGQKLVKGCRLPLYDGRNGTFWAGEERETIAAHVISGRHDITQVLELARSYLHAPYLWGGKTDFGIDCSAFTQMVYRLAGYYALPRDASQQAKHGRLIDFDDRRPGDLAFFANDKGKIIHVGIVWYDELILHAHGDVHFDTLQVDGIWNERLGRLTHTLVAVKRLEP